jgi:hypothetical protein
MEPTNESNINTDKRVVEPTNETNTKTNERVVASSNKGVSTMGVCNMVICPISNATPMKNLPKSKAHMGGMMGGWMLMLQDLGLANKNGNTLEYKKIKTW